MNRTSFVDAVACSAARDLIVVGLVSWSWAIAAGPRPPRPRLPDADTAPAAAASDLLRAVPFDRIILVDGTVMVVEPSAPGHCR